jgi:hypothetical protein
MLQARIVEETKTHILFFGNFLPKNKAVYEIIWKKHCRARLPTDDNMAHAECMLDT